MLVAPSKEIVGYWALIPLVKDLYCKARAGKLDDSAIYGDDVILLEVPGDYLGYVTMICCREQYRHLGAAMLFRQLFRNMESLAEVGIFIEEICCNAYSPVGVTLCEHLGLDPLGDHYDYGVVYGKRLLEDPAGTFLRKTPRMMQLYRARSEDNRLL